MSGDELLYMCMKKNRSLGYFINTIYSTTWWHYPSLWRAFDTRAFYRSATQPLTSKRKVKGTIRLTDEEGVWMHDYSIDLLLTKKSSVIVSTWCHSCILCGEMNGEMNPRLNIPQLNGKLKHSLERSKRMMNEGKRVVSMGLHTV